MSDELALRPYQLETIDWLLSHRRAILGSVPGSGKTRCVLEVVRQAQLEPVLVVCCLRSAILTWTKEIAKWFPDTWDVVVYHGTPAQRAKIIDRAVQTRGFVITTLALMEELVALRRRPWGCVVVDEGHIVKNRKTQAFKRLKGLVSRAWYWVTGSPQLNGPQDLWVPLHLIDRRKFSSYWRWVNENCEVEETAWGLVIGGPSNPALTRATLEPYYWAVSQADLVGQLQPKTRLPLWVELSGEQLRLYRAMADKLIAELRGDGGDTARGQFLIAPNGLALVTRLRQILVSPELVGGRGEAAGLTLLAERVAENFANGQPVAVFTPFARAIPIIERTLQQSVGLDEVSVVTGGQSATANAQAVAQFQAATTPRRVMLATIRSAASWDLDAAKAAYFVGYDWVPAYNEQAEDRLHRLSQVDPVFVYYQVNTGTVDEHILDVLDHKQGWQELVLDPTAMLRPLDKETV